MTTKVVYFSIDDVEEQAEFRTDDSVDDIREIFRAAAEAGTHDILKLHNTKGNLVSISPKLPENTPDSRYKLQVVAAQIGSPIIAELGVDMKLLEERIEKLERKVFISGGDVPSVVLELKEKVEEFREKLENVDHLSWLGLYKDLSAGTSLQPFWNKQHNSGKKSLDHCQKIYEKFIKMSRVQVTDEVRDYLKKPSFDNWQWDDSEMMVLIRQMYIDLGFITTFNIEMSVLHRWLYEIYKHYNNVPFHNFKHCFMVTQMMYGLIWLIGLQKIFEPIDLLILVTAAVCHDLDHPGYNNAYQVNARTELALRYNDISPLENHHCSVAFEILGNEECNIFRNVSATDFKIIRDGMIKCILATDMAKHSEILANFKAIIADFDPKNKEHKTITREILMKVSDISNEARPMEVSTQWVDCLLEEFFSQLSLLILKASDVSNEARPMEVADLWVECLFEEYFHQLDLILIKTADISNEVRPMQVAEPWLECLLEEYFIQSDVEKLEGLPVAPFMDREKVTKPSSQIGFIKFVLLPLFEALGDLFPVITDDIIMPVKQALQYYTDMQNALEEEKKRQKTNNPKTSH